VEARSRKRLSDNAVRQELHRVPDVRDNENAVRRELHRIPDVRDHENAVRRELHRVPDVRDHENAVRRELHCVPDHILLKFLHQPQRKNGTAGYHKYCPDLKFLRIAQRDVQMLHECKSRKQFVAMACLVIQAWHEHGQSGIADRFANSYLLSEDHNEWRYNSFGIRGDSPQIPSYNEGIQSV
jgi:hypothetical protein